MSELKPCPHCGNSPKEFSAVGEYWIKCDCQEMVSDTKKQKAVEAWNMRVSEDALTVRAEAAEERVRVLEEAIQEAVDLIQNHSAVELTEDDDAACWKLKQALKGGR